MSTLTTRRAFMGLFSTEARGMVEAAKGNRPLRLADLPALPDHRLALIRPVLAPGVRVSPGEREVTARTTGRDDFFLFFRGGVEEMAFSLFDGERDLAGIAAELAPTISPGSEGENFASVKQLFLRLVALDICLPGNPIGSAE